MCKLFFYCKLRRAKWAVDAQYYYERKTQKGEVIKNVKKKGRVQHQPDSRLQTLLEQKEPSEKMKYKELSANTVAFISCRPTYSHSVG